MSQFEEKTDVNEEEDTTLSNSEVVTKYLEAGKIANSTLNEIIALSVPGASIADICRAGDLSILAKVDNIYKPKKGRKNVEKGIAFPVCLSVNDCVCHNSPLASDPAVILAVGDVVKVDLGVHVDGYIAVVAHTFVVSGPTENGEIQPITGPLADVVNAAYAAAEIAAKTIRPGNTNKQVTDAVKCAAETYGVRAVAGTLMHQMKRYVIDAAKVILLREEPEHRVEECTFEVNEVYSVDVAMTTGDGRPREQDSRTTIFKRNVDRNYNLKMKASRTLYSEINKKYPTLPFTLRSVEDERQAKLGIKELVQHELLTPYPVLFERTGAFVAHIKFTILLLPNGNTKITGLDFVPGTFVSSDDKVLPEAARELLATSSKKKKPKKKKANTESATTTEGTTETSQEGTEGS